MTAVVFDGSVPATTRTTLIAVARHSLPAIIEASLIPTALFYVAWVTGSHSTAYAAALMWAVAVLICRRHRGERIPGILVLALIGLTIRTVLALWTGSSFLYFAQPILATGLFATVFIMSCVARRPFIARIAGDFYPMTAEVAQRQRVRRLFHRLTMLWAGVQLINAGIAAGMLLTMSPATFIAMKTGVTLAITTVGVVLTVMWSLRVARHEGLVVAN